MGLISKTVKIKWGTNNKKYYIEKGYAYTKSSDEFDVKVEDLTNKSVVIVKVRCDRCGSIVETSYNRYYENVKKHNIYKCKKCVKVIDFNEVELAFNQKGLYIENKLEYKSARENINAYDNDGFKYRINVYNLKRSIKPSLYQNNPFAYYNFNLVCEKNGFTLLEKEWKGAKSLHLVKDKDGFLTLVNTLSFESGFIMKFFTTTNKYTIQNIHKYCELYRNDYQLISDKYENRDELLLWKYIGEEIVSIHEEQRYFKMSLAAFKNHQQRIPLLSISKAEEKIEKFFIENNIQYEREYTFENCKNKRVLPFDFYIKEYNVAIEYQGIQHFHPIEFFGGEKSFKYQKHNDKIKEEYCLKNNIKLILLPYTEFQNIETILTNKLQQINNENIRTTA